MWPPGAKTPSRSASLVSLSKDKRELRIGKGVSSQEGWAVISLLCDPKELTDLLWAPVVCRGSEVMTLALISPQSCGAEQRGTAGTVQKPEGATTPLPRPHSCHEDFNQTDVIVLEVVYQIRWPAAL